MRHFALILSLILIILTGCQFEYDESTSTLKVMQPGSEQSAEETEWKEVSKGLSYTEINLQTDGEEEHKNLMLVRIDPLIYQFSIYENKDSKNAKTIEEIHDEEGSLLTFNGQFFTEDFKPTGLLISEGEEIRTYSEANLLNGILAIDKKGNVHFFEKPRGLNENNFTFAIQNGPTLLNSSGEIAILEDTGKKASRTAIGLDSENNIVLIILKQSLLNFDNSITLYQFAHILKENPELAALKLHSVLNLDGGSSTGLMIDNKYYPEMEKVQNMILVKER